LIPQEGITFDHHFLLPADGANFEFLAGMYQLVVFAKLVGEKSPHKPITINLSIGEHQAARLSDPSAGMYFDWGPDQQSYHPHINTQPES
jgi:hypothetical protein